MAIVSISTLTASHLSMVTCMIGALEIVLILVVVLLIFGGKKIPELMRGAGQGVRAYKKGLSEDPDAPNDEEKKA